MYIIKKPWEEKNNNKIIEENKENMEYMMVMMKSLTYIWVESPKKKKMDRNNIWRIIGWGIF